MPHRADPPPQVATTETLHSTTITHDDAITTAQEQLQQTPLVVPTTTTATTTPRHKEITESGTGSLVFGGSEAEKVQHRKQVKARRLVRRGEV